MSRVDRVAFLVLVGAIICFITARAVLVTLVHDESASLLWFVRPGEWLPFRAHWDANNHYLSSALGILFTRLFDTSALTLRLGSVLAFGVYAWSVWQLGLRIGDRVARWGLLSAMLLCPFLLDFFSLFRGYALEIAGWSFALEGLLRCARTCSLRKLLFTLVGLQLATGAIVALLPATLIVLILLGLFTWLDRKSMSTTDRVRSAAVIVLAGVIPFAFALSIAFELRDLGLLYHGTTEGFFTVTVRSLCQYVLGSSSAVVASCAVLVIGSASMVAAREVWRSRNFRDPLIVIHLVLWADVALRIVLAGLMDVNFPEDRAALHFIPLALLAIVFSIDRLCQRTAAMKWLSLCLLVLPVRAIVTANLDHTLPWPEQSVPRRFIERISELQRASPRGLVIGAHHQLGLAWSVNAELNGFEVRPVQVEGFPGIMDDLRIVDVRYLSAASTGYHPVDRADGPGLWLLAPEVPVEITPVASLASPRRDGTDEFMELAHLPIEQLRSTHSLVEVGVPLTLSTPSSGLRLVVEVNDTTSGKLFYDTIAPLAVRGKWKGEQLRMAWSLPPLPAAGRAVLYLYNPERVPITLGDASIHVSAIRR